MKKLSNAWKELIQCELQHMNSTFVTYLRNSYVTNFEKTIVHYDSMHFSSNEQMKGIFPIKKEKQRWFLCGFLMNDSCNKMEETCILKLINFFCLSMFPIKIRGFLKFQFTLKQKREPYKVCHCSQEHSSKILLQLLCILKILTNK